MHVKGSLHFIFSPQPPSCSDAQIRLFPQKHRQVRLYWSQSFYLQWCKTTPTHRVTGKTFPGNRVKINNSNNNNGNNNKERQPAKMFPYFLKWMQITSASLPPPSHAPKAWWGGAGLNQPQETFTAHWEDIQDPEQQNSQAEMFTLDWWCWRRGMSNNTGTTAHRADTPTLSLSVKPPFLTLSVSLESPALITTLHHCQAKQWHASNLNHSEAKSLKSH